MLRRWDFFNGVCVGEYTGVSNGVCGKDFLDPPPPISSMEFALENTQAFPMELGQGLLRPASANFFNGVCIGEYTGVSNGVCGKDFLDPFSMEFALENIQEFPMEFAATPS
jgi:hypothetical protein